MLTIQKMLPKDKHGSSQLPSFVRPGKGTLLCTKCIAPSSVPIPLFVVLCIGICSFTNLNLATKLSTQWICKHHRPPFFPPFALLFHEFINLFINLFFYPINTLEHLLRASHLNTLFHVIFTTPLLLSL